MQRNRFLYFITLWSESFSLFAETRHDRLKSPLDLQSMPAVSPSELQDGIDVLWEKQKIRRWFLQMFSPMRKTLSWNVMKRPSGPAARSAFLFASKPRFLFTLDSFHSSESTSFWNLKIPGGADVFLMKLFIIRHEGWSLKGGGALRTHLTETCSSSLATMATTVRMRRAARA